MLFAAVMKIHVYMYNECINRDNNFFKELKYLFPWGKNDANVSQFSSFF